MPSKNAEALLLAQDWLAGHSRSQHTQRKYEAQFQQLCEWMIVRDLNLLSVGPSDLNQYFLQLAQGALEFDVGRSKGPLLPKTVALSQSVLRSLFREMVSAGLRSSNPMDSVKRIRIEKNVESDAPAVESSNDWLYRRRSLTEASWLRESGQVALLRALVIAELAFWAGLRRSEIASASMADFAQHKARWSIKVKRFGRDEEDLVEVPFPAMQALSEYRLSRGLTAFPMESELRVPLIARLKSEKYVDPWTVANSLLALAQSDGTPPSESKAPTIVALRRELIHRSLEGSLASRSVAKHVRSEYAVHQIERSLANKSVVQALEKMAA